VSIVNGSGDGQSVRIAASASPISSRDIPILRRATDASSLST
jgi:hypothetical protein